MTLLASEFDALYERLVRRLPARDKLRLLSRLADDIAHEGHPGEVPEAGAPGGDHGDDPFVEEDGLLVIAGPLLGPVPDHRELREERLDQVAGLHR